MVNVVTKSAINTNLPTPLLFRLNSIALADPKVGGVANSEGRFSSLAEMRALLNKCYNFKPVTYREYAASVKSPARFNSAGVYVQFQNGTHKGEIVDFSTVKNIMDYISSADKVALMDYGFREMGLSLMHMRGASGHISTTVTIAEFRKINGAYEDALKESNGSNTPAMRQALKELYALGEKLYPASTVKTPLNAPQQKKRMGGSQDGLQPIPYKAKLPEKAINNRVSFTNKNKHDSSKAPFCTLTINGVYDVKTREGRFDFNGKASLEPLAENALKLTGTLKTTYPNAKLKLQLGIGKTDTGMVSSSVKTSEPRPYPRSSYVKIELYGFKSIPPEMLTPSVLASDNVSFKNKTSKVLSMPYTQESECIIDGKPAAIIEKLSTKIIQNGVVLKAK